MFGFGFPYNTINPSSDGGGFDPDAEAFFTAASITDATQKSAVNQLVLDLKSYNIWNKMKGLYPIVGGSASSHAVNLKTPGTYNLIFATGVTHSSTGMTGDGASGHANPSINTATVLTNNSSHVSFYSRTDIAEQSVDWGVQVPAFSEITLYTKWIDNNLYSDQYNSSTNRIISSNSNSTGFYISNRSSSTVFKVHKNGSIIGTNTNASSPSITNQFITLLAINIQGSGKTLFSKRQCALASIGDGLTDTEAANFYTAVQAYQTTLNRNV